MIFSPLRSLTSLEPTAAKALFLAKNNIAVMSFHTRLDALEGGVNDTLAEKFGVENTVPFGPAGEEIGRIGDFYSEGAVEDYETVRCGDFIVERREYEKEGERRFQVAFSEMEEEGAYLALDVRASILSDWDKSEIFEGAGLAGPSFADMFSGTLVEGGEILVLGNSFIGSSRIGTFPISMVLFFLVDLVHILIITHIRIGWKDHGYAYHY